MISIVVPLIFTVNFSVFLICDGRPWIGDEKYAVEESGDFELQTREPVTIVLSVIFLIRRLYRLLPKGSNQKYYAPVAPGPYSAAPGSPVYQLPTPPDASMSHSFKLFLWNTYEKWQRKLNINPYIPPHMQHNGIVEERIFEKASMGIVFAYKISEHLDSNSENNYEKEWELFTRTPSQIIS